MPDVVYSPVTTERVIISENVGNGMFKSANYLAPCMEDSGGELKWEYASTYL